MDVRYLREKNILSFKVSFSTKKLFKLVSTIVHLPSTMDSEPIYSLPSTTRYSYIASVSFLLEWSCEYIQMYSYWFRPWLSTWSDYEEDQAQEEFYEEMFGDDPAN